MDVTCPNCKKILTAKPEHYGVIAECPACGGDVHLPSNKTILPSSQFDATEYETHKENANATKELSPENYAGFLKRFYAFLIDLMPFAVFFTAGAVISTIMAAVDAGGHYSPTSQRRMVPLGNTICAVASWLYYALMESSSKQGTLGKIAVGIIVTDTEGKRISFKRASSRHIAKLISDCTFLVGYAMAGFTKKKQALHDMVAECLVVNK